MPKKRASLSSILIPPFLLYPLPSLSDISESPRSSTRARSSSSSQGSAHIRTLSPQLNEAASLASSRNSPPPDFLLDDDPFANYTGARPLQLHYGSPTSPHSRQTSLSAGRLQVPLELRLVYLSVGGNSALRIRVRHLRRVRRFRLCIPSRKPTLFTLSKCVSFRSPQLLGWLIGPLGTKRDSRGASSPRALGC